VTVAVAAEPTEVEGAARGVARSTVDPRAAQIAEAMPHRRKCERPPQQWQAWEREATTT